MQWKQTDEALPLPLDMRDAAMQFLWKVGANVAPLDREMLTVAKLPDERYRLSIDGTKVGQFTAAELAAGVNLAAQLTPMTVQAFNVDRVGDDRAHIDLMRFDCWFRGQICCRKTTGSRHCGSSTRSGGRKRSRALSRRRMFIRCRR
jgi:hypothetical protein